jgi:hypothetical protein
MFEENVAEAIKRREELIDQSSWLWK